MNRKLRAFLFSLFIVFTACIGTAFSVFYFGDVVLLDSGFDQDLRVDNVEENYTFGRDEELDTEYTIYLFPSTIYVDLYQQYLNKTISLLPENIFGYIEGDLVNGQIEYTAFTDGYNGINNASNYYNLVRNNYSGSNQYIRSEDAGYNSSYYISSGRELNSSGLGDPSIPLNNQYSGHDGQYLNHNQFRYDRFGCWRNLDANSRYENGEYDVSSKDAGRYLPQKLVVRQSVTADEFARYTMEPFTSMSDGNGWHNITFSSWTSFHYNDIVQYPYLVYPAYSYLSRERTLYPFLSSDILTFFDIMQNLDFYADDNNVIRLFPYFSNGKNYDSDDLNSAQYGGRDALKINYKTSESEYAQEKYFMYSQHYLDSNDLLSYNRNLSNIHYAVLSNIELRKDFYGSFAVQVNPCSITAGSWQAQWVNVFNNFNVSGIEEYVDSYGEGLYNFYFFIGNSGAYSYNTDNISSIGHYVTSNLISSCSELYNKNLISISNVANYIIHNDGTCRPIAFFIEKVSEGRLYKNLETSYSSHDELQEIIDINYNSADNFVMYTYPIHSTNVDISGQITGVNSDNIIENNSYVYLLRNINFTDATTLEFQLRFSKAYITNSINFNLNSGNPVILNPILTNGTYNYNENQVFVSANNYFNDSDITFTNGNATQEGFTLKDEDYKGLYDILLIYSNGTYNMYSYRHTINFIKVFEIDTVINIDSQGLAIHTKSNGDPLDSQIWQGRANLGEFLEPSMLSSVSTGSGGMVSLQTALENYLDSEGIAKSEYKNYFLRDFVSEQIVMYYIYDENTGIGYWETDDFTLLKNYLFIVEHVDRIMQ